ELGSERCHASDRDSARFIEQLQTRWHAREKPWQREVAWLSSMFASNIGVEDIEKHATDRSPKHPDVIWIGPSLSGAEVAHLASRGLTGLILTRSSSSSHAVIVARARKLPIVIAHG